MILIRGVGRPDALPDHDLRLRKTVAAAYGTADPDAIRSITDGWRPFRAWVAFLLRTWREAETNETARGRRSRTRLASLRPGCTTPPGH